ncbi:MAG: hypothetical protein A3J57_00320 [Candidatus Wildermuthbacteria bacterium RIFCSPHIGHO2_02_FULL_49_12b]|nr:MAG: hypothetical protein A3J57_00320 [Candidatus Wildermuthbacteria bacterium RIFCSPHIGHO2_02_FULL_49_12b]
MLPPNSEKGFALLFATVLTVGISVAITGSVAFLALSSQTIMRTAQNSSQALFAAESGLEDAAYRVKNSLPLPLSYTIPLLATPVEVNVASEGVVRTVSAKGIEGTATRNLELVLEVTSTDIQFFYGAHIGDGGLIMDNNSRVEGNVYSNGSIQGDSGAVITETVTVGGANNEVAEVIVEGDAFVDQCDGSDITNTLHVNTNQGCTFGSLETLGTPPDSIPLPISAAQIQQWKDEAEAGGITSGTVELDGDETLTLGPRKIVGNLEMENSAILTLTGTLWVTGDIIVKNSAQVRMSSSYGATSGVIIADGTITLDNNSVSSGSGTAGSYLMYLTTNSSSSALNIKNNAILDIAYASAGTIVIENNTVLKEATGYQLHLKNNATIEYELGLTSSSFSSGLGGGWEVTSWKEIE